MISLRKIWRYRKGKLAIGILLFFLLVALLADFIANDKPIYCTYQGQSYFPILNEYAAHIGFSEQYTFLRNNAWNDIKLEKSVYPIIKFSSSSIDQNSSSLSSPGATFKSGVLLKQHWLGSDPIGRDVAAGLVHGSRKTILISFFVMLIACMVGFFMGILSGYYGDDTIKVNFWLLLCTMVSICFVWFQWWYVHWSFGFSGVVCVILIGLMSMLNQRITGKQIRLPLDLIIMRLIEIFKSVPALFILLALLAIISKPSMISLIIIIGLLRWSTIARVLRAELLHLKEKKYITSAKALGASDTQIILRHLMPNAISPLLTIIAFGFAGTILIEATISFLGIGLAADEVTWGSILSDARNNFSAWWLAVFPGAAIFLMVIACNFLGDTLNEISIKSD